MKRLTPPAVLLLTLALAADLDAPYAPYALADKLIFVGRQGEQYFVVYDGQRVSPVFDRILLAYCCEPAMYSIRGGSGRYTFWGTRGNARYMVEISAL